MDTVRPPARRPRQPDSHTVNVGEGGRYVKSYFRAQYRAGAPSWPGQDEGARALALVAPALALVGAVRAPALATVRTRAPALVAPSWRAGRHDQRTRPRVADHVPVLCSDMGIVDLFVLIGYPPGTRPRRVQGIVGPYRAMYQDGARPGTRTARRTAPCRLCTRPRHWAGHNPYQAGVLRRGACPPGRALGRRARSVPGRKRPALKSRTRSSCPVPGHCPDLAHCDGTASAWASPSARLRRLLVCSPRRPGGAGAAGGQGSCSEAARFFLGCAAAPAARRAARGPGGHEVCSGAARFFSSKRLDSSPYGDRRCACCAVCRRAVSSAKARAMSVSTSLRCVSSVTYRSNGPLILASSARIRPRACSAVNTR